MTAGVAALVELLFEALGGRRHWAAAQAVHSRERVLVPAFPDPIESDVWRSVRGPGERARITGVGVDRVFAWDLAGGAGVREGVFYRFDEERMRAELAFWPVHVYTIYHRLAAADPRIAVDIGDRGVLVVSDTEREGTVSTLRLTPRGEPIVWNGRTEHNDETYVYGPLAEFGPLRMPRWGASIDGGWRYELLEFHLTDEPPPVEFTVSAP